MQLTVHRETIKTSVAMGCKVISINEGGWITK